MLSRREWLLGLSGAGLALSAPQRQFSFGCQTNAWPVNPADRDTLFSAIHKIGALGYSGFETGFRNLQVAKEQLAEVKQRIADSGLTFYGIHIFLGKYDEQSHIAPHALYEAVGQIGAALGAQRRHPQAIDPAGLGRQHRDPDGPNTGRRDRAGWAGCRRCA